VAHPPIIGGDPRAGSAGPAPPDDEGAEPEDDNGSIEALTKALKGQRWDADKSVWK
jgi:hypothetical protein